MATNPNPASDLSVILYAKDCARLARFYAAMLQLPIVEEEAGFARLAGDRSEFVVVQVPPAIAETIRIADPPLPRGETPFKPSFLVGDIRPCAGPFSPWEVP